MQKPLIIYKKKKKLSACYKILLFKIPSCPKHTSMKHIVNDKIEKNIDFFCFLFHQ